MRKKTLKPSEKFRFNFDWEAQDDTSKDLNPLYNNTHEAALLFGRGLRAGVDRREQMKAAASHQQEMLKKMRQATVRAAALDLVALLLEQAARVLSNNTTQSLLSLGFMNRGSATLGYFGESGLVHLGFRV